jgi:biopolymer transport protein ExbD
MKPKRSRQYALGTLSELNVTPLLDLAFVLLIIFMITAPFLAESADLVIPSSKASRDVVDPSQVFTVSMNMHRGVELEGNDIALSELPGAIQALKEDNPTMGVIVKAHNLLTVQDLIVVMDVLRDADIAKIAVVTKPEGEQ